jgi:hypothetical protein
MKPQVQVQSVCETNRVRETDTALTVDTVCKFESKRRAIGRFSVGGTLVQPVNDAFAIYMCAMCITHIETRNAMN